MGNFAKKLIIMQDIDEIIYTICGYSFKNISSFFSDDVKKDEILKELNFRKNQAIKKARHFGIDRFFISVVGIPGAGKSTFCKNYLKQNNRIYYLAFDDVMESISFYQDEKKENPCKAFEKWELPARILGYEILKNLLALGCPILFENSMTNPQNKKLLLCIKENFKYKIEMKYLDIEINEAIERVKKRYDETKRWTPEKLIRDRKEILNSLIVDYQNIVDNFKEVI